MARIYLSNWDSHKIEGCYGPGRILSISVVTSRLDDPPFGVVSSLTPRAADYAECNMGKIDLETYREGFFEKARKFDLAPGKLLYQPYSFFESENQGPVEDGDTLCCMCNSEKSLRGKICHHEWVAELLSEAGWEVILDGKKVAS